MLVVSHNDVTGTGEACSHIQRAMQQQQQPANKSVQTVNLLVLLVASAEASAWWGAFHGARFGLGLALSVL